MTQARFSVVPAVYLAVVRDGPGGAHDPQVLLQLRHGTAYMDGRWACAAAGHVEQGESLRQAAVREAGEELSISMAEAALQPVATLHRTCALAPALPVEERMDVFFCVHRWEGEPRRAEPDKAAQVRWWPLAELPDLLVPHERQALEHLRSMLADPGTGATVLSRGFDQHLTLVAAVGSNGVIGDGTGMPWHLPGDLRHFKETTLGGVLVMGRGTWDSIGRALPGRRTVVLTRDRSFQAPGAEVAHSLPEALNLAGDGEVFIAGGGQIYAQTIAVADRLALTLVEQAPRGSVTFPALDAAVWREVSREPQEGFAITQWRRR